MSDLKKYITGRKKTDEEFAKGYEEGFEDFKIDETFAECVRKAIGKKPAKFWLNHLIRKPKMTTNSNLGTAEGVQGE